MDQKDQRPYKFVWPLQAMPLARVMSLSYALLIIYISLNPFDFDFQNGIHEKKPELLYVILPDKYEKVINLKKKIYGFSEDWIALSSMANGIDRGYEDGLPYIKEKIKGSFKSLEVECNIYVVSSVNFLSVQNSKMKFVTDRPIKIIKSMEIENILNLSLSNDSKWEKTILFDDDNENITNWEYMTSFGINEA
jgi:hypothetical protein